MTKRVLHKGKTLGEWASLALKKHFQKTIKHEADVLKDREPEALHQMRVGMRRLRSACTGFGLALDLPKSAQEEKIGKIARRLGQLRDLDVLLDALKNHLVTLPSEEQKSLEEVMAMLTKQRHQTFAKVQETLDSSAYEKLKESLQDWLKHPTYQEVAQLPLNAVLPDLLLPEISRFFLHPGWLVGTKATDETIKIHKDLTAEAVTELLTEEGELLHSLRKESKRVRYQMELFTEFYGPAYAGYLQDVKNLQEVLGKIQDSAVLSEVLTDVLKSKLKTKLPTLLIQLEQTTYEAWQEWQIVQDRYLSPQTRQGFHVALLQPLGEGEISDEKVG